MSFEISKEVLINGAPADIAGGMAGAAMEFNAHSLRGTSQWMSQQAADDLARAMRADPQVVGRQQWYRDLDRAGNREQADRCPEPVAG